MELYKSVCKYTSLEAAWKNVRSNIKNSKSSQVPSDLSDFEENQSSKLRSLQSRLVRGSFSFSPQTGVAITKSSGGHRPIVVACLEDRIVQRAILQVVQKNLPSVQTVLSTPTSFGAIPKEFSGAEPSGVKNALETALKLVRQGYCYFYRSDIESFFTKVKKKKVIEFFSNEVDDKRFLTLLDGAMRVSLINAEQLGRSLANLFPSEHEGIIQGSSLSPLIANIYLHDFDKQMNRGEVVCLRYLDDILILSKSHDRLMASVKDAKRILGGLGLSLYNADHGEKGKASKGNLTQTKVEFLGCSLTSGHISPTRASKSKLLEGIDKEIGRFIFKMNMLEQGSELEITYPKLLENIRLRTLAWSNSYKFCTVNSYFKAVDGAVAERLRNLNKKVDKASKDPVKFNSIYGVSTCDVVFGRK